jgi:hypothetical protein
MEDAMDNEGSQGRVFPKKGAVDDAAKVGGGSDDKLLASGGLDMLKAGGVEGGKNGPTGSPREYPKGGKPAMDAKAFNPMNDKSGCSYGTVGVGKGEG